MCHCLVLQPCSRPGSPPQSFEVLDAFYNLGGNFLDTANNYQNEEPEIWIDEWMKARGNREQLVVATKYTTGFRNAHRDKEPLQSNYVSNSMKSMQTLVQHRLEKLQTDYIDLLYVHWWDFTTSVEEVMHGLNNLINSGKVLYLGVSDTPAWLVVKANDYAKAHGLRPFSVYQGKRDAGFRGMERVIIPICRDQGMAICPWAPVGQGKFKSSDARKSGEKGIHPIVGQRAVKHLKSNIDALGVSLTKEDMRNIDEAAPFDIGFPMNFVFQEYDSTVHIF
ncbi:norsolorinic acid reductase [Boeremia exigua]|uniref:norsolorinic acid reductase n=1 Tax=Boeremia exigua TaxID=749465 RepID=UPI001E8ECDBD|nr:norsolorinic acid reductase [Boeremia exigua]KAH6613060.1 norsolorinic acid reductase [Boeremia exigua]